ncbi:MAG TPA: hypothetical protein VNE16_16320 [Vicinamibacterales bacterium]|nr:hypothetical protein [Vicinamibacterales bacterium]
MLVDRLSWLAADAPNEQVRAIASFKMGKLADRLKAGAGRSADDQAEDQLLASDITRFLARPYGPMAPICMPGAPPGAPLGDTGMDWLAPAPVCGRSPAHPDSWTWRAGPGF